MKPKTVVVVGPTASGKSELAIKLALEHQGEVISADSRQVYKGFDIGTAKVTETEMQGVVHHLIDVVDTTSVYTTTDFKRDAAATIADITARKKIPIIAGGTFFYIDTLLERVSMPAVAPNPALRAKLESKTAEELYRELQDKASSRANTIDPNNKRRLVRALEIYDALGHVPEPKVVESPYDALLIGIETDKEALRDRIAARAPDWLRNGFREEVSALLEAGVTEARLIEMGFEYQLGLQLLRDELDEAAFIERFTEKNWQYAKRQLTWLKRDNTIEWFTRDNYQAISDRVKDFIS